METYGYIAGILPLERFQTMAYPASTLQGIGQLAMGFRKWDLAQVAFERQLAKDPNNTRVKSYLIRVYDETNNYDSAIEMLEEWVSQNPGDSGAVKRLEQFKKIKSEQN